MKKILLNMIGLRSVGAVLFVCLMAVNSFGQAEGDYRSTGAVSLTSATNWQVFTSGVWGAAGTAPDGTKNILNQSGNTFTIDIVGFSYSAYMKNSGNAIAFSGGGTITFSNGSTYEHNTTSAMPVVASTTWGTGSTAKVTGATTGTSLSNSSQNFYHFIWDCANASATMQLSWADGITIGGDITINNTGTGKVRFTSLSGSTPKTINITGSVNVNNTGTTSTLESTGSGATGLLTINVGGNVTVSGGSLFLVASSAPFIWNVSGNFTMTSGTVSKGSGSGSLTFVGSGFHTFNRALAAGTFSSSPAFILGGTGTLTMGTSVFDGGGAFTVNSGTTLESASLSGVLGNIQTTGTKTFSSTANYTFNAGGSQSTSAFVTSPTANTVNNLTINNASGVTLTSATTVSNTLSLTSGKLTLGANDLTIGSGGTISGGSSSNYIVTSGNGVLKRTAITGGAFPVGPDASNYNPVTVANSAANDFSVKVATGTSSPSGLAQPAYAVNRTWNITSASTSADITFGYDDSDVNGSCVPTASMTLAHHNGTAWESNGTATPSVGSGTDRQVTFTGVTAFSPFIVGNAAVLSTELVSFKTKANNQTNLLTWTTATEKNNSHFNIERSTNGVNFTSIGTVKGNGTTTAANNYTFTDETPLSINYYRLQSVDFDGKTQASNIVSVFRSASGKLKVFPTITSDKLTIVSDSNEAQTFGIYDLMGKIVQTGQLNGQKELLIPTLSNGTYILKVGSEVVKFVKN